VSGVGKYLKENNPEVEVLLADPVGSIFTNYFRTGEVGKAGKFMVEGVGKGSIPGAMDFGVRVVIINWM
jgi:cystathionine beta-synthase